MDVVAIARAYFLDERNQFGCAETTFIVLKGAYGLDDPMDAGAAMALNVDLAPTLLELAGVAAAAELLPGGVSGGKQCRCGK